MYTNEMGNNLLIGCSVHALLVGGAGAGATGWSLCGWLCRVLKTGKNWLEYIIQLCIYSWGLVPVDTLRQLNFTATPIVFLRIYLQSRSYRLGPTDRQQEEEGQDFGTTAESQKCFIWTVFTYHSSFSGFFPWICWPHIQFWPSQSNCIVSSCSFW